MLQGRPDVEASEQTAMGLYNLEHLELLRDPSTSTKCLVAWGHDTVLVAFRGTANRQNAMHDIKVRFCAALTSTAPYLGSHRLPL